jgi:hypothetical protein
MGASSARRNGPEQQLELLDTPDKMRARAPVGTSSPKLRDLSALRSNKRFGAAEALFRLVLTYG